MSRFRPELDELFFAAIADSTDPDEKAQLMLVFEGNDEIFLPDYMLDEESEEDIDSETLYQMIANLKLPGKLKLAMLGNKAARAILIRDKNKQVPLFVLQNPKITEPEILEFAGNPHMEDRVLRVIANNSQWMKDYALKQAICNNPRSPVDVSMKWLKHLRDKDLRDLGRSKGIPQVIATQSRKLAVKRSK